ncbi:hypothetical protein BOTBODRAFT_57514 [Botryobasidium botryosum FD-172 SS1]|uniref:Protein kinase domain-containing protein n=1 Tax=Botryobasidium botryosum (strain FD-172 SS1) TaxID=930990 RepID=A0A067M8Z9_BOTB1|nr:hypothetical protein BOTBODRAFT_57514 [Botryobasidium botryosum FD-172 SS1]
MEFDIIPFEDIKGDWKKLGAGSFGNVYKGNYLGIEVAIKEVLPSNEYDVAKYFDREWHIMKEARHPNVVLYLGLSHAPPPDGRIFIISEFIDNGNLRVYIQDKSKPLPWRLRVSFATDISRALAYLHARKCIHRDLKGENLLVTSNGRLKITDFGFARLAARNEEESRVLTYCGTDSYMSPEIIMGDQFDISTDIFSLGVIFCEIVARKLADDHTFKRRPPNFGIDPEEVKRLASPGCPPDFIALALECASENPSDRPTMPAVLERLRAIELQVLTQSSQEDLHVGSIKFLASTKRPGQAPRIPSFGMGVKVGKHHQRELAKDGGSASIDEDQSTPDDSEDEDLLEAVLGLRAVDLRASGSDSSIHSWKTSEEYPATAQANGVIPEDSQVERHLLDPSLGDHSTSEARSTIPSMVLPSTSSILTIRASPMQAETSVPNATDSILSTQSYHTASSSLSQLSIAAATEGGSTIRSPTSAMLHRFTLIKPGAKRNSVSGGSAYKPASSPPRQGLPSSSSWNPLDFLFMSSGRSLGAKCDLCSKRLGWKPVLECDDCGLRAHLKCGEIAPLDCGARTFRAPPAIAATPTPGVKGKMGAKMPGSFSTPS